MCGIIGFTGNLQAPGILVDGLQQLEYRGYDSAGIAVNNGSETQIVKTTGKVATLREKVAATAGLEGTCGIGHTRWATWWCYRSQRSSSCIWKRNIDP